MNKLLIVFLALGGGLLLFVLIGAVSFGYLPQVGETLHMGGAKDLGVTYTDVDYINAKEKFEAATAAQAVKQSFSGEELTALINGCSDKVCLVKSVQVKTYADGGVEISGMVDRSRVVDLLRGGVQTSGTDTNLEAIAKYLPTQPSFYVKAVITGQQDVVVLDLEKAKIAGLELTGDSLIGVEQELESAIMEYLASLPGTQIHDFTISEAGIFVDAELISIIR